MCNSIDIQRTVTLERCKALFLGGASIEHVLGVAWNAGFCEADRDTGSVDDAEFDARVNEINRELEAIESGSAEPPQGEWIENLACNCDTPGQIQCDYHGPRE